MKSVRIAHSRKIDAAPESVGALLDGLGSEHDALWPADRWPADMRVYFDRPLAEGARGGHGNVHYTVDDHEPGRRVWFRFEDPGLDGRHGFDVVATESGGTELVHTLEGDVDGATRLAWPLIRSLHDAYVEDIFDQAELAATGTVRRPARQPRWMRAMNGFVRRRQASVPPARLARTSGWVVSGLLAGIAAIHAAWALGWRWPGGSDQALADRVVAPGAELPSAAMTWGVVGILSVAIAAVMAATVSDRALPRLASWGVAGALGLRGVVGVVTDFTAGFDDIYEHLDLAIYSPLCLGLAAGAAIVAQASFIRSRRSAVRQDAPPVSDTPSRVLVGL